MGKKEKKIEENFYTSSIFTFDSYACSCKKSKAVTKILQEEVESLEIVPILTKAIHFAFGSKVGLVRLTEEGSIEEENILGKLAGIDSASPADYIKFFASNGFLLPIKKTVNIPIIELQIIVNRIRATLELLSSITTKSSTGYEKEVQLVFYHLFNERWTTKNTKKYEFATEPHSYINFLETHKNDSRDNRYQDTFNNSTFSFDDTLGTLVLDADWVDAVLKGTIDEEQCRGALFRSAFTSYCAPRNYPKKQAIINDFVFRYFHSIGVVCQVSLLGISYENGLCKADAFDESLKNAIPLVAKYVVKEEIEYYLNRVHPSYNIDKMEPAWKIDSLLCALYFSLFYLKPNLTTYRRCANPKCGAFFPVSVSSRRKIYCSHDCMNRMMAARKRAKDKQMEI